MNPEKFDGFLANAKLLGETWGFAPLLYGSLGLEVRTGADLGADDIDLLIPNVFLTRRWQEFRRILETHGYRLTDEKEHTFVRDGVVYAYADLEDLEPFAEISVSEIPRKTVRGTDFLLLSLEQYLRVYESSVRDGYRVNVRQKKDGEKIQFIQSKLDETEQEYV